MKNILRIFFRASSGSDNGNDSGRSGSGNGSGNMLMLGGLEVADLNRTITLLL
jgi:hypothetical protein